MKHMMGNMMGNIMEKMSNLMEIEMTNQVYPSEGDRTLIIKRSEVGI